MGDAWNLVGRNWAGDAQVNCFYRYYYHQSCLYDICVVVFLLQAANR